MMVPLSVLRGSCVPYFPDKPQNINLTCSNSFIIPNGDTGDEVKGVKSRQVGVSTCIGKRAYRH